MSLYRASVSDGRRRRMDTAGSRYAIAAALQGVSDAVQIDLADISSLYVERASPTTQSSADGLVGWIGDVSQIGGRTFAEYMAAEGLSDPTDVPGNHVTYESDAGRATLRVSGGVYRLEQAAAEGTLIWPGGGQSDYQVFVSMATSDTSYLLLEGSDGSGLIAGKNNTSTAFNGSIGSPSLEVNGVAQAIVTRDDLWAAMSGGTPKVAHVSGADMSGAANVGVGNIGGTSAELVGSIYGLIAAPGSVKIPGALPYLERLSA
jgi:hypothetical protein